MPRYTVLLDGIHWDVFEADNLGCAHNQAAGAIDAAQHPRPDETIIERKQRERLAAINKIYVRAVGGGEEMWTTAAHRAHLRSRDAAELERMAGLPPDEKWFLLPS